METNEDKITFLKIIAKTLIIHYLKNHIKDEEKISSQIERINRIFENTEVVFENVVLGSQISGSNNGSGKITVSFYDKNNITPKEFNNAINTIIHEYYHSISDKIDNIFLEEGYVTEITAETIRYAIEKPIDFDGITKDEFLKILKDVELKNGYFAPSEFVRSSQVIMNKYGYNGMMEYIYSKDGVKRLCEIAEEISPEFGEIMRSQYLKSSDSTNYIYEKDFFLRLFKNIDFSDISETNIEMNNLLQTYLIDSGIIRSNKRIYDIVKKYDEYKEIEHKDFYNKTLSLSEEELREYIRFELSKCNIEYQSTERIEQNIGSMVQILDNGFENSEVKVVFLSTNIIVFAKLIAYDMYQRGIRNPTEEDWEKYIGILSSYSIIDRIFLDLMKTEFDEIYKDFNEEKDISEILKESIEDQTVFEIMSERKIEETTQENFWNNVEVLADMMANLSKKKGCKLYTTTFYNMMLKITKKYFGSDKIYDERDWQDYRTKMTEIFKRAGAPLEFLTIIGHTPDKLFLKSVSEKKDYRNRNNQILKLLQISCNKMDLGSCTYDLQDLEVMIYFTFNDLIQKSDNDKLDQFSEIFLEAYYTTLELPMSEERRIIITTSKKSAYALEILEKIIEQQIYNNPNKAKELFKEYSRLLFILEFYSEKLLNKMIMELPEDTQNTLRKKDFLTIQDLREVLFGKRSVSAKDFPDEIIMKMGDISKFCLITSEYLNLYTDGEEEEAEEFWNRYYKTKEIEKKGLLKEVVKMIKEYPDEVNFVTMGQFSNQMKKNSKADIMEEYKC